HGHWERLLVCLLGFILARVIVMRLIPAAEKPACAAQEAGHAP
ncbi:MAG: ATP synthase subunit I, partial [bacterium]